MNEGNKKLWYKIGFYAENDLTGYVHLTPEQADIVKYALNPDNWKRIDGSDEWCGCCAIDLNDTRKRI